MLYGTKDGTSYAFYLDESKDILNSFVEVNDADFESITKEAAENNKIIAPDENGAPILSDPIGPTEEDKNIEEVIELKAYLSETDYVVIKIAEGAATAEDYAEVITKRQAARARINELENE